jgi:hypothetical protein
MRSIRDNVQSEIIDILTGNLSLSYNQLFTLLKTTKNDKTFRINLQTLWRKKIVKRRRSKEDKRMILYSIRGFELESVNNSLSENSKLLSEYEHNLQNYILSYLEYSLLEVDDKERTKHRLKLAKAMSHVLKYVFDLNQAILFVKIINNIPLLRKLEYSYKVHFKKLRKNLDLLRKYDLDAFTETLAVSILKSRVSKPGLFRLRLLDG